MKVKVILIVFIFINSIVQKYFFDKDNRYGLSRKYRVHRLVTLS